MSSRPKNLEGSGWNGIVNELAKELASCSIYIAALDELFIAVSNNKSKSSILVNINSEQHLSLVEFDLVIFRTVGVNFDIALTVVNYLKANNIKFIDSYLKGLGGGKLSCASFRVLNGFSVPDTFFIGKQSLDNMKKLLKLYNLNFPFVLKDNNGKKGRLNYLVRSIDQLRDYLLGNSSISFIIQNYIESDRDYRVLVLNYKISLVLERRAKAGAYANNTSQGGSAELVSVSVLPDIVKRDIQEIVKLENLEVAGVDIIFDKNGQYYILEVNRAPQIFTGAFIDQKVKVYANMIEDILK